MAGNNVGKGENAGNQNLFRLYLGDMDNQNFLLFPPLYFRKGITLFPSHCVFQKGCLTGSLKVVIIWESVNELIFPLG